jgi:hypothetical protein
MYIYVQIFCVYESQGEFVRFHEVLQRMQDFIFEALYNRHALEHRLRILQVGHTLPYTFH